MKISFLPFVLVLLFHNKTYFCYAVVNLRVFAFGKSFRLAFAIRFPSSTESGCSNGLLGIWLLTQASGLAIFRALVPLGTLVGSNGLLGIWLLTQPSGLAIFRALVPLGTLVGSNGLGPSTSRLSGVCSNQLSYEPIVVEVIGFEPMTPCLQGRCSTS